MNRKTSIILLSVSLVVAVAAVSSAIVLMVNKPWKTSLRNDEGNYTMKIDSSNALHGGNVATPGGTNIHFDEYGVNEGVSGGLLELAAYGSISLQTRISGIETVDVWSEVADGKDFYLTIGATPNSCEFTLPSKDGHVSLNLKKQDGGDFFFFSVHNKMEKPIVITKMEITYSCVDDDDHLRKTIDDHLCAPMYHTYNGKTYNPYYGYPIDPSSIPANRYLIPTLSEDEYPMAPGNYRYGYEVYDVDVKGNPRKLLYTRTKTFEIIGMNLEPPDSRKVFTFHVPDGNGKEKLICQEVRQGRYDITQIPAECQKYDWDSPYNDFQSTSDEHYYPVFRVSGISAMKEGDGCYPVHTTYSYLERGFTMPEPQMKPGYRFGGWYMDAALTTPFDENKLNPGNLTLYAKCIETDLDVRRVYYHYEDGTLAKHIDYLFSDDNKLTLPEASNFMDLPRQLDPFYWAIFCDTTYIGLYKQSVTEKEVVGDKIKYSDFAGHHGDIHAYASTTKRLHDDVWSYDLFTKDSDGNDVFQHTMMAGDYERDTDFIIPGFAVHPRDNGEYHDQADSFTIDRTGQFFVTDEKKAYVMDGGTLKTIASYGYGNISMGKPLAGILRHESVQKVGRRAFFNRYGIKGTYFPRNATDFEIEAYANVTFDKILTLPKTLTRIGDRCFMGSSNIQFVCLPRSIKTIGPNAFAYGSYNSTTRVYENITNRTTPGYEPITFLYEGSEKDFNILDDVTKAAITNNAYRIIYNYSYGTYYGRG